MKQDDSAAFIQVGDTLFNLRYVKSVRLSIKTLEVCVPQGINNEVTHMLHENAAEIFERLKVHCINS